MPRLYTIGHSTHSLQEFMAILDVYHISHLVDVRTIPKSRHVPWFNKDEFSVSLAKEAIRYTHLSKLGGLRKGSPTSINTGWRNASFRSYADYMQTKPFYEGLKELHELIKNNTAVAIMCAEAVPWRCHRSLIADAEIIRNIKVFDIISKNSIQPHKLTDFAVVNRQTRPFQIYYPKP
ncbi:TPA: DUF488 family protein [Legionella feeleii]|uniref:Uncharacterized conserved protein n=1 Tax=Legionella feeleii TaxID=453 RepID=A0A378IW27_9GAMM|nr:DUF488 domain-containing protein [Legionella feeleii]STX38745.1 Uncharacterized conserved protein [Legionella feeleii]